MQKTEKHYKTQYFDYDKTTKIKPKTGPKTQKSASEPGYLRNHKKDIANQKIEVKKIEKHRIFFSLFACRFWTDAFTNRSSCQIALTRQSISITTCDPFGNWHDACQTSYFPFAHLALGAYPIRRLELAQARHTACEEN